MTNFLLIFACLGGGWALRRLRALPASTPALLNGWVIYVALPALTLAQLHGLALHRGLAYPIAMGWLLFGLALAAFPLLGKALGWSRSTVGALVLTAGFANTSFVGFPLLAALYGPEALRTGVIVDQLGSFLPLTTAGLAAGGWFSERGLGGRHTLRKLATFPPFVALVLALLLSRTPFPSALLGALVSVGFQLSLDRGALERRRAPVALGLVFKLVLAPLALTLLYVGALGARGRAIEITLLESAMAPMITGSVIAAELGLDAELANLLVAIGIPLSLITVPIWHACLARFAG